MLVIETARLTLRDFCAADLPAYQQIRSHREVQQFYAEREATIERGEQLIQWFIRQAKEQPRTTFQLAITLDDGPVIGSCGIRIESIVDKQGSFGCELGHAYWRQGYAFEASRALVDFGFSQLGLHRIFAETLAEHASAIQLAKKLGMRVEGEFREHRYFRGRWWNTIVLALVESEWQSISSNTGTEPTR